jgi:hypothetical protein
MNVISTDQGMQHLRADEDDREYVELLMAAAEDSAAQFMNRRFYPDVDDCCGFGRNGRGSPGTYQPLYSSCVFAHPGQLVLES